MAQSGRNLNSADYKFGYNGKEKDDETEGSGNSYDYGFRMYDLRVGKFLSIEPLETIDFIISINMNILTI